MPISSYLNRRMGGGTYPMAFSPRANLGYGGMQHGIDPGLG